MKMRQIKKLPVMLAGTLEILGRVEKAVLGDDFRILYLVLLNKEEEAKLLFHDDFILADEAVFVHDVESIKSYAHGEELSIYGKKLGDRVFDLDGKELGVISDFVIDPASKKAKKIEIFSGVVKDVLSGRKEVPLEQVRWASTLSAMLKEGSDGDDL